MPKFDFKLYLIPAIFFVILIIVILILPFGKKSPSQPIDQTSVPTPTLIETKQRLIPATPTPISPTSTGVKEEELPKETLDLASQKQALRKKTPLKQSSFTITFNYSTDLFDVALNEPKDGNRNLFEQWLKDNYPAIPMDRFIIK